MPTAREGLSVAEVDGKIYAIGGKNMWGYFALDVVEIFDTSIDRWTTGPPLIHPRIYSAAAVHNGKIFVFGGRNGFWLVSEVEMLDPVVGHWIEVTDMYSKEGLSATTMGDSIIVLGGKTSSWMYSPYANVFNPATYEMEENLPNYPIPRAGHGAVVFQDSLFILGGVGYGLIADVSIYDRYGWVEGTDLPFNLGNTGAATQGNSIYVVGGNKDFYPTNTTLQYDFLDTHWTEIDTLNTARENHGVVICNNKLYAIGGATGGYFDRDYLASMEVLDLGNTSVHPRENIPESNALSIANYPNPFSQYTSIKIDLGSLNTGIDEVVIYNILGREVMEWHQPDLQNRQLTLRWDGTDIFGNYLPSGVYFLRINNEDLNQIQKITISR